MAMIADWGDIVPLYWGALKKSSGQRADRPLARPVSQLCPGSTSSDSRNESPHVAGMRRARVVFEGLLRQACRTPRLNHKLCLLRAGFPGIAED
jgi:hypothetical protein